MTSGEPLNDRVIELESAIAHLQHHFDQLNQVVLRQQTELDQLKQIMGRLEGRMDQLDDGPEKRDTLEERPPHY